MGLFSEFSVGSLKLRNRVVMAPLSGNQANADGSIGPEMVEFYAQRARGGVGLVVTEALRVTPHNYSNLRRMASLATDDMIPGLRAMVEAVHAGGAAIFGQLTCMQSAEQSALAALPDMTIEQIGALRDAFVAGAARAHRAGCDGVELHMAHGTGLADFVSRAVNRRSDGYGRNVAGRARLALEIIAGIRDTLGPDYLISCRFSADECMMGGNTLKETVPLAQILVEGGATMLSVSAGGRKKQGGEYSFYRAFPMHDWPDALNAYLGAEIKRVVNVPVMVAGKIGTAQVAEDILTRGQADMVGLGRALLADPDWADKAREGRSDEIDDCVYCHYCRDITDKGEAIRCVKTAKGATVG